MRIALVGYSRTPFDVETARAYLCRVFDILQQRAADDGQRIELISGWSNMGVPRLGYEEGRRRGFWLVGLAPRQLLEIGVEVFPVDEHHIVGERFGDESATLIGSCDVLVRVGNGAQAMREAAMFRERLFREGVSEAQLAERLLELDLPGRSASDGDRADH